MLALLSDFFSEDRKAYIIDKYKNKTFTKFHPLQGDKDSLNEVKERILS